MRLIVLLSLLPLLGSCGDYSPNSVKQVAVKENEPWGYVFIDQSTGCRYAHRDRGLTVVYRNDGKPDCPDTEPKLLEGKPLGPTGCVKVGTDPDAWLCVERKGRIQ